MVGLVCQLWGWFVLGCCLLLFCCFGFGVWLVCYLVTGYWLDGICICCLVLFLFGWCICCLIVLLWLYFCFDLVLRWLADWFCYFDLLCLVLLHCPLFALGECFVFGWVGRLSNFLFWFWLYLLCWWVYVSALAVVVWLFAFGCWLVWWFYWCCLRCGLVGCCCLGVLLVDVFVICLFTVVAWILLIVVTGWVVDFCFLALFCLCFIVGWFWLVCLLLALWVCLGFIGFRAWYDCFGLLLGDLRFSFNVGFRIVGCLGLFGWLIGWLFILLFVLCFGLVIWCCWLVL